MRSTRSLANAVVQRGAVLAYIDGFLAATACAFLCLQLVCPHAPSAALAGLTLTADGAGCKTDAEVKGLKR